MPFPTPNRPVAGLSSPAIASPDHPPTLHSPPPIEAITSPVQGKEQVFPSGGPLEARLSADRADPAPAPTPTVREVLEGAGGPTEGRSPDPTTTINSISINSIGGEKRALVPVWRPPEAMERLVELTIATCASPETRRMYRSQLMTFLKSGYPLNREGVALYVQGRRDAGATSATILSAVTAIRKLANEAHVRKLMSRDE